MSVTDVPLSDNLSHFRRLHFQRLKDINSKSTLRMVLLKPLPTLFYSTLPCKPEDELLDKVYTRILNIIDLIALMKVKVVPEKKKIPQWRNTPSLRSGKTRCGKSKCRWQKVGIQVYLNIYKERLYKCKLKIKNSRESHQ